MSFPFPFPGPIAPETNPKIEPEWFQPSVFPITGISYGTTTVVTTGTAIGGVTNNFVIGQLVRFNIPPTYGSQPLSGSQAYVVAIPGANQVTVAINTSQGYNAFVVHPNYGPTPPQIAAIGDINSGTSNSQGRMNTGTFIPGSFENISPTDAG